MSLLFSENVFDTTRDFGKIMRISFIIMGLCISIALCMFMVWYGIVSWIHESNSIAVVGQYSISNYSGGDYKVILLSKQKLNGSIILENDNDITDKLLLVRLPY